MAYPKILLTGPAQKSSVPHWMQRFSPRVVATENVRSLSRLPAEDERTADAEYRRQWRGTDAETQPKLTFFARVDLRRIIDLENEQVIRPLGLTHDDLFGPWRLSKELTPLQHLGLAISRQRSVAAVRFPSAALSTSGRKGWNLAIFPLSLESPNRVEILSKSGDPLEVLP